MKSAYIGLLLLFLPAFCFSQDQKVVDSLVNRIEKASDDTNKVNLYYHLGRQYDLSNTKQRIVNYIYALNLAKKISYHTGYKKICKSLIALLVNNGMYEVASDYCIEYAAFCENQGLTEEKFVTYTILGNLLTKQERYGEAMNYFKERGQYDLDREDFKSYASVLHHLGNLYLENQKYDSALVHTLWSAEIFKRNNMSSEMAGALLTSGKIYTKKGEFEKAEEKTGEAQAIYSAINEKNGIMNSWYVLAGIYAGTQRTDEAFNAYSKALVYADSLNSVIVKKDCYKGLSEMYIHQKNYKESYEYQILYKKYEDSLANEKQKAKMLELEVKYDIARQENAQKDQELIFNKRQKNFIVILLVIIVVLTGLLYKAMLINKQKR